ncbi:MAG TPA: ABC transporter ATP-binding protein, partial [Dehalococcoidia bacterium]|nr:ABC transporter ATP-binding protein [Dehalococcoidia bacterium]
MNKPAVTVTNQDGSVINADSIRKLYGDFIAVAGITLRVEPGETYGLLGPNGAGKTTT